MISAKQIDIRFEGDNFRPSELMDKTKWPLNILVEAGQISPRGKFKGKPSPYGIAFFTINMNSDINDPIELIDIYSDKLLYNQDNLRESGVEDIIFDIETSNSKEYNYSLDEKIIKKLSQLNARVDFHGNEMEIDIDQWLKYVYLNHHKYLSEEENSKFITIRNKIIHSSKNIHVFNISHIYDFMIIYMIKYMGHKEQDIPSFENSYLEFYNTQDEK